MDIQYTQPEKINSDTKPQHKFKKFFRLSVYLLIFFSITLLVFAANTPTSDQEDGSWIDKIPIISQIKHLVESADKQLKGEERDRINILLLGMGGKNHDGGYLTDTIILASLEPSTGKAALISFPRDLTIPIEGMGWRKINNVNAYAEAENQGSGGLAISQALADILDLPIDYYVRLDFDGFVNIINELGGIEVEVENTLDDPLYPILGQEDAEPYENRFEHLYIEKGLQTMDGELALKYVRSRHGLGGEGSDFARARRQQQVITAVKNKLLSKYTLFKPLMISNIIDEIQTHLSTNLKLWEILKLWDIFKNVDKDKITNKVLDNTPNGLLASMITEDGAYILTPRSGDFAEIQYLVHNIFSDTPGEYKARVTVENASLEIRNGTWVNGLASQTALDLEKYGFEIIRIGNSSRRNFQKSVIYDLTYGEKIDSLTVLKDKTGANVSFDLPQWLMDDIKNEVAAETNPVMPDFILIIGQEADASASGLENTEE